LNDLQRDKDFAMNSNCGFLALSFLMTVGFLYGIQSYERNDPDMYIHVNMLKNKQIDIQAVLHEAKMVGQTAKDLIEIKKIEGEVIMQKNRQSTFMLAAMCCMVVGVTFFSVINSNSHTITDWIKAWKGRN
jgi:hypothetical protein